MEQGLEGLESTDGETLERWREVGSVLRHRAPNLFASLLLAAESAAMAVAEKYKTDE